MNDDTLDRLIEQVGPALEQLGDGFEHVYHAAVRQAIVTGIIKSVIGLLLVIFAIVVWRVSLQYHGEELVDNAAKKIDERRIRDERHKDGHFSTGYWLNEKEINVYADGAMMVWTAVLVTAPMVGGLLLLITSLDDLINPHWEAVELILNHLR